MTWSFHVFFTLEKCFNFLYIFEEKPISLHHREPYHSTRKKNSHEGNKTFTVHLLISLHEGTKNIEKPSWEERMDIEGASIRVEWIAKKLPREGRMKRQMNLHRGVKRRTRLLEGRMKHKETLWKGRMKRLVCMYTWMNLNEGRSKCILLRTLACACWDLGTNK